MSNASRLAQQRLVLRKQADMERDALVDQAFAARQRWHAQCSTVAGAVQAIGLTAGVAGTGVLLARLLGRLLRPSRPSGTTATGSAGRSIGARVSRWIRFASTAVAAARLLRARKAV